MSALAFEASLGRVELHTSRELALLWCTERCWMAHSLVSSAQRPTRRGQHLPAAALRPASVAVACDIPVVVPRGALLGVRSEQLPGHSAADARPPSAGPTRLDAPRLRARKRRCTPRLPPLSPAAKRPRHRCRRCSSTARSVRPPPRPRWPSPRPAARFPPWPSPWCPAAPWCSAGSASA
jgi:hypothetical protein